MFTTFDILDKGTIAGIAAGSGFAVGTIMTAAIATLMHDAAMDKEERKRNLISIDDLTNHKGTEGNYNVFKTYEKRLSKLFDVIQEHYGLDKKNEFKKMVEDNALYLKSSQDNKVIIPDLSTGLLKRSNRLKGSGADRAIMNIFSEYKQAKGVSENGIDIYVTMMQILQNIIIIYNEFLNEQKALPEIIDTNPQESDKPKVGKLQAMNTAMVEFVKGLKTTHMFKDGFKFFGDSKRDKNLPKIYEMIETMGNEAVRYQKQTSFFKRSNMKFMQILNSSFDVTQALERMSEKDIYHSGGYDSYILYNRMRGVISTDIYSHDDIESKDDDVMARKVFIRHLSNTHATFMANTPEFNGNYSHLDYLINVTNENSYETDVEGNFYLPSITKVTTTQERFNSPLTEKDISRLIPDIHRYLLDMNVAGAMQADLSFRLSDYGSRGLAESGELQYRQQLINVFIKHAKQIATSTLLAKNSYFAEFIARTNDSDFINQADAAWFQSISSNNLTKEDKDKENYTQPTQNTVFNILLNDMLHVQPLRKASIAYTDMEMIDTQFSLLMKSYKTSEGTTATTGEGINNEFLLNVCLAAQDQELQNDILAIKLETDSTLKAKAVLDGYIKKLNDINLDFAKAFNNYYFPERNSFSGNDQVSITTNYGSALFTSDKVYKKFQTFMTQMSEHDHPLFAITRTGNYTANEFKFQNKTSMEEFSGRINDFIARFNKTFENELKNLGKNQFLIKFRERFTKLTANINEFSRQSNMTEAAKEKLQREQQELEFKKTLSAICASHDSKTKELIRKIEGYQGKHKQIIEKLFSKNNRIFEGFIDTIRSHTDQYNNILTDAAVKIDADRECFFSGINEGLRQFTDAESTLFLDINDMLSHVEMNNQNSDNINKMNEKLLNHIDKLSILLNETLPELINKILSTILASTKSMNEKYELAINHHQITINRIEANNELIRQENDNASNTIVKLHEQVSLLETKLTQATTELNRQKISIDNVDRELRNLSEIAADLPGMIESDDYKNAKAKLEIGINKFLKPGIENLKSRYTENSAVIDAEMNELFSNFDTVLTMVKIAEEKLPVILTKINAKINEIISLNLVTLDKNSIVTENITKMSESLHTQKKYILDLQAQITTLRSMYDLARTELVSSLKSNIRMLEEQKKEVNNLNTIIHEGRIQYETVMVKQTESLNNELQELKNSNKQLVQEKTDLSCKITELDVKLKSEIEASTHLRNNLQTMVQQHESTMRESELRILSESSAQLTSIQNKLGVIGKTSLNELKKNQAISADSLAKNDETLDQVKIGMSDLNKSLHDKSTTDVKESTADDPYSLINLKSSCHSLVTKLLDIHKPRLKFDKNNGKAKFQWLKSIAAKLNDKNLSSEEFIDAFKTFMILSLENKNGNHRLFNWPWTTMGRGLVTELNQDISLPIRVLLFGEKKITYAKLAGKLLCESSAMAKAKELIHGKDTTKNAEITLTIHRFTPAKSGLTTITLQTQLGFEKFKNETNKSTDQFLHKEMELKKALAERDQTLAKVSKKTNKIVKSIGAQIEDIKLISLPSSPVYSKTNPFLLHNSQPVIDTNPFSPANFPVKACS